MTCLSCEHGGAPIVINYDNQAPYILEQEQSPSFKDFQGGFLRGNVHVVPIQGKRHKGPRPLHQLGGNPGWMQCEEIPLCPNCEKEMEFIAQLDTDPGIGLQFADNGRLFVFICTKCKLISTFMQDAGES